MVLMHWDPPGRKSAGPFASKGPTLSYRRSPHLVLSSQEYEERGKKPLTATKQEAGHVARTDTTEGQALWQPGNLGPSSEDSFHSPTVIPPLALDKPSIMKRYDRRRTCSHISPRRSPMMVTLHDTLFVECRWWNDGWTVKTVVN